MLFDTKEKQDFYIKQTIKNVVCDQTTFNLSREHFGTFQGAYGYLLEELQETEEALEKVKSEIEMLWKLIKSNASNEALCKSTALIEIEATELIHEAIHTSSVAKKMLFQLKEKAPLAATK